METEYGMRRQLNGRDRPGFYHRPVKGMSIAILFCGFVSVGVGIAALVVALLSTCTYRKYEDDNNYDNYRYNNDDYWYDHGNWGNTPPITTTVPITTTPSPYYEDSCRFVHTYLSPGIWGGLMFVTSGIVGIIAAHRKTTCMIVSMMALSIVTAWVAVVSIVVAIMANFDKTWTQVSPLPVTLHVASGVIALVSLITFVLSWIKFGIACRAVCCNGSKGYPKIKERFQYQPLQTHPMMYAASQPQMNGPSQGNLMYATSQPQMNGRGQAPVIQPQPTPSAEPIYLVQGQQVIGVLPQAEIGNAPTSSTGVVMAPTAQA